MKRTVEKYLMKKNLLEDREVFIIAFSGGFDSMALADILIRLSKEYHFELTSKDNKTAIVYELYKTINYLKKGDIEFTKTDFVDGDVIPNTLIEIYTDKEELIFSGKTNKQGVVA